MPFVKPAEMRFQFNGLNTRRPPDRLEPTQYPIAVNVRGFKGRSVRVRPGYETLFTTQGE